MTTIEATAARLVESGRITRDFAALVLGRRECFTAAERRAASLALADWYEERGRMYEARSARDWAETWCPAEQG